VDSLMSAVGAVTAVEPGDAVRMVLGLLTALAFGIPLSLLYGAVYREKGIRTSFLRALVVLPLIASSVSLAIGNNLVRAFGLIGVVALVRFRTRIKNTLDMAFIFLAISLGMTCGSNTVWLGAAVLAIFAGALLTMRALRYGDGTFSSRRYQLTVNAMNAAEADEQVARHLGDVVISSRMRKLDHHENHEIVYEMALSRQVSHRDLLARVDALKSGGIARVRVERR
jgi:uncharacterized membrane protein YhiD involved in acid resistance